MGEPRLELSTLLPGDEAELEAFLRAHVESSMFLRSNVRRAGLLDGGEPFQATYVAVREQGRIVAAASHAWNGKIILQAPVHLPPLVRALVQRSLRPVTGLLGPWDQAVLARATLALEDAPTAMCSREDLFCLALGDLVVPDALVGGDVVCRRWALLDADWLTDARVAFEVEALHLADGAQLRESTRAEVARITDLGVGWVLEREGARVACSNFNASLPDVVQIGGVYCPPPLRARGHARAVVAGSLLAAREDGVERAILFTGEENAPARRAYEAIGFRRVGDYALILLE